MAQEKRWNRTRFTEKEEVSKSFYNQPAYMFEIGDREEGGALLVNGIEVNKKGQGVQNRDQLDLLIERAAQESPLTIPSIRALNDKSPNLTEEESLKRLRAERDLNGPNWNHRHLHPWTYGEDIGVLEITSITEYVGNGWKDVYKYPGTMTSGRETRILNG